MGYWIPLIIGACLGVYVLAFVVRAVLIFVLKVASRTVDKRRLTYLAVVIASVVAFGVSGLGAADGGQPNYSQSWIYLLAGAIVFVFERWRLKRRERDAAAAEEEVAS